MFPRALRKAFAVPFLTDGESFESGHDFFVADGVTSVVRGEIFDNDVEIFVGVVEIFAGDDEIFSADDEAFGRSGEKFVAVDEIFEGNGVNFAARTDPDPDGKRQRDSLPKE